MARPRAPHARPGRAGHATELENLIGKSAPSRLRRTAARPRTHVAQRSIVVESAAAGCVFNGKGRPASRSGVRSYESAADRAERAVADLGDDVVWEQVMTAHRAAVDIALNYVQDHAAYSARGSAASGRSTLVGWSSRRSSTGCPASKTGTSTPRRLSPTASSAPMASGARRRAGDLRRLGGCPGGVRAGAGTPTGASTRGAVQRRRAPHHSRGPRDSANGDRALLQASGSDPRRATAARSTLWLPSWLPTAAFAVVSLRIP
jgi:hypothetical protein